MNHTGLLFKGPNYEINSAFLELINQKMIYEFLTLNNEDPTAMFYKKLDSGWIRFAGNKTRRK